MRQLSVLTVMALVAGSAFAGGVDVADPPDIQLNLGAAASNAFDMNDYFATSNAGAPTFSGGVVAADGMVSIPGSSAAGLTDHTIGVAVGADSADVEVTAKVSSFMLAGGAGPDDNMTLIAQSAGSNVFVNCLRAGVAVDAAVNLTGGPDPGAGSPGNGTPGNGSPPAGGASWIVTFANVSCGYSASGLLTRTSAVTAHGAGSVSSGGLTASIDADGKYTLSSDASFTGPVVVTFVKKAGNDMDSASLLASADVALGGDYGVNDFNTATIAFGGGTIAGGVATLAVDAAGLTQAFLGPYDVGTGSLNWSVDAVNAGAGGVSIAVMDANFSDLSYVVAQGGEIGAQRLSVTFAAPTGSAYLVLQAAGGAAAGSVTYDNAAVCAAEQTDCYAPAIGSLGITGFGSASPVEGDLSGGVAGLTQDINAQAGTIGFNAATVNAANNFETAGTAGSVQLSAAGTSLSNITVGTDFAGGPATVRIACWAQVASSAGQGATAGIVQLVGGSFNPDFTSATNFGTFANVATVGSGWTLIEAATPVQSPAIGLFSLTVQAAISAVDLTAADTLAVNIDDLQAYAVDDRPEYFDATLLGS